MIFEALGMIWALIQVLFSLIALCLSLTYELIVAFWPIIKFMLPFMVIYFLYHLVLGFSDGMQRNRNIRSYSRESIREIPLINGDVSIPRRNLKVINPESINFNLNDIYIPHTSENTHLNNIRNNSRVNNMSANNKRKRGKPIPDYYE